MCRCYLWACVVSVAEPCRLPLQQPAGCGVVGCAGALPGCPGCMSFVAELCLVRASLATCVAHVLLLASCTIAGKHALYCTNTLFWLLRKGTAGLVVDTVRLGLQAGA